MLSINEICISNKLDVAMDAMIKSHTKEDVINKPKHYTQGGIEPIDYIMSNKLDFLEANVIKYTTRYKFKNGLEDLQKARFYINKLIERESKKLNESQG